MDVRQPSRPALQVTTCCKHKWRLGVILFSVPVYRLGRRTWILPGLPAAQCAWKRLPGPVHACLGAPGGVRVMPTGRASVLRSFEGRSHERIVLRLSSWNRQEKDEFVAALMKFKAAMESEPDSSHGRHESAPSLAPGTRDGAPPKSPFDIAWDTLPESECFRLEPVSDQGDRMPPVIQCT